MSMEIAWASAPPQSIFSVELEKVGSNNSEEIALFLDRNIYLFNSQELNRASLVASKIRNLDLLHSVKAGKTTIYPCNALVHFWNIALQSAYFDRLGRLETKDKKLLTEKREIHLGNNDQESLTWIAEYLEASNNKRQEMCTKLTEETLLPLLFQANMLDVKVLKEDLEIRILKLAPFSSDFFENFTQIDTAPFPLLHTFLFLTQFLGMKHKKLVDETIQTRVQGILFSPQKEITRLKVRKEDLPLLKRLQPKGVQIQLFIDESWKVNDEEWNDLYEFGKNNNDKNIVELFLEYQNNRKIDCLEDQLKKLGHSLIRPSPKVYYIDRFAFDNYFPQTADTPPQIITERYEKQKNFFYTPCPAEGFDLLFTVKGDVDKAFSLFNKFPELGIGLSLTQEALASLKSTLPSNISLLAFDGREPVDSETREKFFSVINSLPHLKIVVLGTEWLELFNSRKFLKEGVRTWKNLTGTVKQGNVRIKGLFDFEWVKVESLMDTLKESKT